MLRYFLRPAAADHACRLLLPVLLVSMQTPLAAQSVSPSAEQRIAEDLFQSQPELPGIQYGGWKNSPVSSAILPAEPRNDANTDSSLLLIRGTGGRNNPYRRELATTVRDRTIYVRFWLRYAPAPAPPAEFDPEFFVLWLDRIDGGDTAVHNNNTPNIGLHVADRGPMQGRNVFMIRIGSNNTAWTEHEVIPGRDYTVVAALSRDDSATFRGYSRLQIWINPTGNTPGRPDAQVDARGPDLVRWVGFATGLKTEPADEIQIGSLVLSHTWQDVLNLDKDGSLPIRNADGSPLDPLMAQHRKVSFSDDIYPLLRRHCFDCHAGSEPDSGVRLDQKEELLGFSTGQPLVIPRAALASRLIEVLEETGGAMRMPPADHAPALSQPEKRLLAAWINQGLDWDHQLLPPAPRRTSDHWAFQPIWQPPLPEVQNEAWVRTPIDRFIAAAHEQAQLTPAAEADSATIARRLSLSLTGLPPDQSTLQQLLHSASPSAWQDYSETLLQSQQYGERWGRLWLDLTRWAESHGHQHDLPRPFAWRYRDYVIRSFRDDLPFDRFLREQIAGDEMLPVTDDQLIATGFLGAARISGNEMNKAIQRNEMLVDIVNATSATVLGLTIECAQCHNHKTDPISQRDYYRLQAFFTSGQPGNLLLQNAAAIPPDSYADWMPAETFDFYQREADKLIRQQKFARTEEPHTWGFYSATATHQGVKRLPVVNRDPLPWQPTIRENAQTHLLIRGDTGSPGPVVQPGWPEVLGLIPELGRPLTRSDFADWLTADTNPLVARVWVNRIWQHHFGRGLVSTSSDFGIEGSPPSHPELLDWLAVELISNNWSTRHIQRLIVNSATFRQAADFDRSDAETDPENQLLHRWPVRRLEAETIRDAVLAVSEELDRTPAVGSIPPQSEAQQLKRTIYLYQRRSELPEIMRLFDAPDTIGSCARRETSTVAQQSLFLLNSDFMQQHARSMANLIRLHAGTDTRQQVIQTFARVLGRTPSDTELEHSERYLTAADADSADEQLRRFCQAMFSLNEFHYLP